MYVLSVLADAMLRRQRLVVICHEDIAIFYLKGFKTTIQVQGIVQASYCKVKKKKKSFTEQWVQWELFVIRVGLNKSDNVKVVTLNMVV